MTHSPLVASAKLGIGCMRAPGLGILGSVPNMFMALFAALREVRVQRFGLFSRLESPVFQICTRVVA